MSDDPSPCQLGAADPAYAGYLTDAELIETMNDLLEAARPGGGVRR